MFCKAYHFLQTRCNTFKSNLTLITYRVGVRHGGSLSCALDSGTKDSGLSSGSDTEKQSTKPEELLRRSPAVD